MGEVCCSEAEELSEDQGESNEQELARSSFGGGLFIYYYFFLFLFFSL